MWLETTETETGLPTSEIMRAHELFPSVPEMVDAMAKITSDVGMYVWESSFDGGYPPIGNSFPTTAIFIRDPQLLYNLHLSELVEYYGGRRDRRSEAQNLLQLGAGVKYPDGYFLERLNDHQRITRIGKGGSDMYALTGGNLNGVLVHKMGYSQALIWADLYNGKTRTMDGEVIPVAPILETGREGRPYRISPSKTEAEATVFSCFSGFSIGFLCHKLDQICEVPINLSGNFNELVESMRKYSHLPSYRGYESDSIQDRVIALVLEGMDSAEKTLTQMEEVGVIHGHPHMGNRVVFFVENETLERHIGNGGDINDIPLDDRELNPLQKILYPDRYQTVAAFIDFDAVSTSDEDFQQRILPQLNEQMAHIIEYYHYQLSSLLEQGKESEANSLVVTIANRISWSIINRLLKDDHLKHPVGAIIEGSELSSLLDFLLEQNMEWGLGFDEHLNDLKQNLTETYADTLL